MADKDYIDILIDGLKKKKKLLLSIMDSNEAQFKVLEEQGDKMLDLWEELVNEKAKLIDEINELDQGFQEVYNRVSDELSKNKSSYQDQIRTMQGLIKEITEIGIDLQASEAKNKSLAQQAFVVLKKRGRSIRQSNQVAKAYADNMKKLNFVDPQFLDRKN